MSVTACQLDRDHPLMAEVDERNLGSYTLKYIVTTAGLQGPISTANQALAIGPDPLPAIWSNYSYQGDTDNTSFAKKYVIERHPQTAKLWYITVLFSPLKPGEAPVGTNTTPYRATVDPLSRPPVTWWDREVFTDVIEQDVFDKAVINKAEDLYPDVIEQPRARGVLVGEINVGSIAEVKAFQDTYDGAVNGSAWTPSSLATGGVIPSYESRSVVCREVAGSQPITDGVSGNRVTYFTVTFRFVFAKAGQTWDHPKVEQGYVHWSKDSGSNYEMEGAFRKRTEVPGCVRLEADGLRRGDGLDPIITKWRIRSEQNFNLLPF